jgi:hypothetical protein
MRKTWRFFLVAALAMALGACASGGANLTPGQSTAADVEKSMGRPAEKITTAAGESVWFYPTAPNGTSTRAARMRADGTLIAVEERLSRENWSKIVAGRTTAKEVRELIGPPGGVTRSRMTNGEEWTYKVMHENRTYYLTLTLSPENIAVSKVELILDPIYSGGSP